MKYKNTLDQLVTCNTYCNLSMEQQQRLKSALKISPALTSQQSEELMKCAVEHHEVFALDDGEMGEVIDIEHQIHTGDSPPIHQLPQSFLCRA